MDQKSSLKQTNELPDIFHSTNGGSEASRNVSWVGLALIGVTGGVAVALSIISAPFVAPALRKVCLPYVPASTEQVQNVLRALKSRNGRKGGSLVDLGSGDGRVVMAASQQLSMGRCVGVELNYWLVLYSRYLAWRQGDKLSTFVKKDLWTLDLNQFSSVVIFGVDEMMPSLERKLVKELPPGGCVVACRFPLPGQVAARSYGFGLDTVWLYTTLSDTHGQMLDTNDNNGTKDLTL